jgi:hypothetical protein
MNKEQVIKFWEALEESTSQKEVISSFKNKTGSDSEATLKRYAQIYDGFKSGLTAEEVKTKNGYGKKNIDKFHDWWASKFSAQTSSDTQDIVNEGQNNNVAPIINGLKEIVINGQKVDGSNALLMLRGKLVVGMKEREASATNKQLFEELTIRGLIQTEQRRTGLRDSDLTYWVLTDLGKKVIQSLEKSANRK